MQNHEGGDGGLVRGSRCDCVLALSPCLRNNEDADASGSGFIFDSGHVHVGAAVSA